MMGRHVDVNNMGQRRPVYIGLPTRKDHGMTPNNRGTQATDVTAQLAAAVSDLTELPKLVRATRIALHRYLEIPQDDDVAATQVLRVVHRYLNRNDLTVVDAPAYLDAVMERYDYINELLDQIDYQTRAIEALDAKVDGASKTINRLSERLDWTAAGSRDLSEHLDAALKRSEASKDRPLHDMAKALQYSRDETKRSEERNARIVALNAKAQTDLAEQGAQIREMTEQAEAAIKENVNLRRQRAEYAGLSYRVAAELQRTGMTYLPDSELKRVEVMINLWRRAEEVNDQLDQINIVLTERVAELTAEASSLRGYGPL